MKAYSLKTHETHILHRMIFHENANSCHIPYKSQKHIKIAKKQLNYKYLLNFTVFEKQHYSNIDLDIEIL